MPKRDNPIARRRRPVQARSRQTVEDILEGATRVFRREGWDATTNRIAEATGVSIGTLYEYFPNKEALLLELAERHVALAERGVTAALAAEGTPRELLAALQAAVVESQRFPSEALALVGDHDLAGTELDARARALRERVLGSLTEVARAAHRESPELAAEAAFGAIGTLSVAALQAAAEPRASKDRTEALLRHHLAMAVSHLTAG